MNHSRRTLPRLCVIALLLLAVSPVTAPFSTCDLLDLLGGPPSTGGAVLQSKTTSDEPVSGVGGSLVVRMARASTGLTVLQSVARPRPRDAFHVPLRI